MSSRQWAYHDYFTHAPCKSYLWLNGICIHGEGDDTFMFWFDSKPDGNTWTILSGTGK